MDRITEEKNKLPQANADAMDDISGGGRAKALRNLARGKTGDILEEIEKMLGVKIDKDRNDFNKDELLEKLNKFFSDTIEAGDEKAKAIHDEVNRATVAKVLEAIGEREKEKQVEAMENAEQEQLADNVALADAIQKHELANQKMDAESDEKNEARKKAAEEIGQAAADGQADKKTGTQEAGKEKKEDDKVVGENENESDTETDKEEDKTSEEDEVGGEADTEDVPPGEEKDASGEKETENPVEQTAEIPTKAPKQDKKNKPGEGAETKAEEKAPKPAQKATKKTDEKEPTEWFDNEKPEEKETDPNAKGGKKISESAKESQPKEPAPETPETNKEAAPDEAEKNKKEPAKESPKKETSAPEKGFQPYPKQGAEEMGAPLTNEEPSTTPTPTPEANNQPEAQAQPTVENQTDEEQERKREFALQTMQAQQAQQGTAKDEQLKKLEAERDELIAKEQQLTPSRSLRAILISRIGIDLLNLADGGLISSFLSTAVSLYQLSLYFRSPKFLKKYLKKKSVAFVIMTGLEQIDFINILPLGGLFTWRIRRGLTGELSDIIKQKKMKEKEIIDLKKST